MVKDLTGRTFGKLKVVSRSTGNEKHSYWLCLCDCGAVKHVRSDHLLNKKIRSCGCLIKTIHPANFISSNARRLRGIYENMLRRCYNQSADMYPRYGGRGITVCNEWRNNFRSFVDWSETHGYKKGLSIDRIDNDKGYSPDNCRWATMQEQQNNRSNNRKIEFMGTVYSVHDLACLVGLSDRTIHNWIDKKKSAEYIDMRLRLAFAYKEDDE